MGLSFHWWPTRPSSESYASRDTSSGVCVCWGVLVSSYCCSTYRIADPFSSLVTFSSSSIGGPVVHPIADCEHPLLVDIPQKVQGCNICWQFILFGILRPAESLESQYLLLTLLPLHRFPKQVSLLKKSPTFVHASLSIHFMLGEARTRTWQGN
jgi:hypothetical protein